MVRLEIGIHEREGLNNIEESWVTKTVNGYRRNGENCCVNIQIHICPKRLLGYN